MKLSEAILLGSVGTGQAFGMYEDHDGNTCALGSAFVAAGLPFGSRNGLRFDKGSTLCPPEWRWIFNSIPTTDIPEISSHKDCYRFRDTAQIWYVIPYLNDICKWTRPQIAEWVKTMEAIYDLDQTDKPVKEIKHENYTFSV